MRNKLVINIIIAYFVVLCVVFFIQLKDNESENFSQSQTVEVTNAFSNDIDKLKDTVVIEVGSSSFLLNDKLSAINSDDETIVPKIINNSVFVPTELFSNVFKGDASWDESSKVLTLRYNNKAIIFKQGDSKIKIIDNLDETEAIVENNIEVSENEVFVPLKVVSDVFEKNVFFDRNVVVISNKEIDFDAEGDKELIDEFILKLKTRNVIAFKNNDNFVYYNDKVSPIDESNKKIAPIVDNGQVYIPVKMISSILDGETSWNSEIKELDVKFNDIEAIFTSKNNTVNVIKDDKKSTIEISNAFKIINSYSYLSLDTFANVFEKNLFIDNDLVILSGKDNVFAKEKDKTIIEKINNDIKKISE